MLKQITSAGMKHNLKTMQILPSKELFPFIKHYLFLESKSIDMKILRLFSDGNTGIVFSLKNNLTLDLNNDNVLERLPNSFYMDRLLSLSGLKINIMDNLK